MYLLGVNLPDASVVPVALTKIFGVGKKTAESICDKLSIHRSCRLKDVPESKIVELSHLLNGMTIETELRREIKTNIANLAQIGCYRGERHKSCLPVRGQLTRTNARTAKKLNGRQFQIKSFTTFANQYPIKYVSKPFYLPSKLPNTLSHLPILRGLKFFSAGLFGCILLHRK